MRDNEKCNISQAPSPGLRGTQFSMLNVWGSLKKPYTTIVFVIKIRLKDN